MLHKLPKTPYTLDSNSFDVDYRLITNIFTRISISQNIGSDRFSVVEKYTIKDGDSPESIAEEKYQNVSYWWLVLVANPQIRKMSDWPKTDFQIDKYLDTNFGDRKFENVSNGEKDFDQQFFSNGEVIDYANFFSDDQYYSENIREIFIRDNDNKRIINLITPTLVPSFVSEYNKAIDKFKNEVQQNTIL